MTAALIVVGPGLHTTLQDFGRPGYQNVGVPVSGALDPDSLCIANALVGNEAGTAALEIRYVGPVLEVAAESARFALAGATGRIELTVDGASALVPAGRAVTVPRGAKVRVPALADSATAYLAVEGGFDVGAVLGSRSTYVRGHLGGYNGGTLAAGDRLPLNLFAASDGPDLTVREPPDLRPPERIRVVLGPQDSYFTDDAIATFLSAEWTVSTDADRMGARLDGPALTHRDSFNIVSDGIATGAVQVPGSGQPILLLADRQTTGGYPKIGTVISADLPAVGRMGPGDRLRFAAVSTAEAVAVRRRHDEQLERIVRAIGPAGADSALDLDALYRENLVSGVVGPFE
jgi:allophanate hydrolase